MYIFCLIAPILSQSQLYNDAQLGLYWTAEIPNHKFMPKLNPKYGIGLQASVKPIYNIPVFIELKGSFGTYNKQDETTTYYFDNETSTQAQIYLRSSSPQLQLGLKTYFSPFEKTFRGFITPQIGLNFMRSSVSIYDLENSNHVLTSEEERDRPLERKVIHKSTNLTYGIELGIEIDSNKLFTKQSNPENRFYFSTSFINSFRSIEYINTNNIKSFNSIQLVNEFYAQSNPDNTVQYVDVTNGKTSVHKIAEIYRTPLRLFTINIGYVWYL